MEIRKGALKNPVVFVDCNEIFFFNSPIFPNNDKRKTKQNKKKNLENLLKA